MYIAVKDWADRLIQSVLSAQPFDVTHHSVQVAGLPEAFHGFTIAQISDLHIDRWNAPVTEAAVDAVNALHADLVVCTGDVIAHGPDYLSDVTHLLRQFKAKTGKMACLGNHDYSDGSRSEGVRHALRQAGFDLLVNDSTLITRQGRHLQLAGADDLILGRQCLGSTARRLDASLPTLLLSHNPENFAAMARFQPDLILSGHTHGGQIRLPDGVHQRLMGSPYLAGLYQDFESRLYVNRGLGAAVFVHHWEGCGDGWKDGRQSGRPESSARKADAYAQDCSKNSHHEAGNEPGWRLAIPTPRWWVRPEVSVFTLLNPALNPVLHSESRFGKAPVKLAG